MSLLRHHFPMLIRSEMLETPALGAVYRIRPHDGDSLSDNQQRWWMLVDLAREGDFTVAAVVSTSFDGVVWYPVATVSPKRTESVVEFTPLEAFAPLLRVETKGGDVLPKHRITARLASDGPFTVVSG